MRLVRILLLFVLAFAAPAKAQTHYYGGIDLGSKGTKAALFSQEKEYYAKTINTPLVSSMKDGQFTDAGIQEATDAVKQLMDAMKEAATKNKLQNVNFFVVGSSAVAKGSNKDALVTSVKKVTGIDMDFIDAKQEGYFGLSSTIPRSRVFSSLYVDIGSGNTKLGCLVGGADIGSFRSAEIEFGSVSGRKKGLELNPTDIKLGIQQTMREVVAPSYEKSSMDIPCLRNRDRIYWTGGASWATATFIHPEKALSPTVIITKRDLDTFLERLSDGTWNQKNFQFAFPKDMPLETQQKIRERAEKDRESVLNIFVREDLMSGVSIMRTVLDSSNPSAVVRFVRSGGNFLAGYAMYKFHEDRAEDETAEK